MDNIRKERLTSTDESGHHHLRKVKRLCFNFASKNVLVQELGDYEEAEEKGLILRLPCKVGDKVYIVAKVSKKILECTVIGAWICEGNSTIITDHGTIYPLSCGETVFFTREEAWRALKGGVQE